MALAKKPYVVIDAEILSSSIWEEKASTRLVWVTLLILCDTDGYVGASLPGIARAAAVTLEEAKHALDVLQAPDPHSRTQTHEGRRVETVDRGYRILNFIEALDRLSAEKAKSRDRVRRHRMRKAAMDGDVTPETPDTVTVTADPVTCNTGNREKGEGRREKGLTKTDMSAIADKSSADHVFAYWQEIMGHPSAKFTPKRKRAILGRLKDGYGIERLKAAIRGCNASPWHQGENDRARVYDDIELICRDGSKVEAFEQIAQAPKAMSHNERVMQGFRERLGMDQ